MTIEIEKPTTEHLEKKGVSSWPIWEKEISRFDWRYDSTEECYLLEGEVVVEAEEGEEGYPVSGMSRYPSRSITISDRIQTSY